MLQGALQALVALVALVSCTTTGGQAPPDIPIRANCYTEGKAFAITNANVVLAGGVSAGEAAIDVLGMRWREVRWDAGTMFLGRVKPEFSHGYALDATLPFWATKALPSDVTLTMGQDGKLHALLTNGLALSFEPPPDNPGPGDTVPKPVACGATSGSRRQARCSRGKKKRPRPCRL